LGSIFVTAVAVYTGILALTAPTALASQLGAIFGPSADPFVTTTTDDGVYDHPVTISAARGLYPLLWSLVAALAVARFAFYPESIDGRSWRQGGRISFVAAAGVVLRVVTCRAVAAPHFAAVVRAAIAAVLWKRALMPTYTQSQAGVFVLLASLYSAAVATYVLRAVQRVRVLLTE
jgi:hypothetical protein